MIFKSIIPNTNDAKVLIERKSQFKALQYKMPEIKLDTTCINKATIGFESRISLSSIDKVQVFGLIGTTNFHIVNTPILFLFCLKNMDTLSIYLNNIAN